jgi:hypothetical protein
MLVVLRLQPGQPRDVAGGEPAVRRLHDLLGDGPDGAEQGTGELLRRGEWQGAPLEDGPGSGWIRLRTAS